MLKNITLAFTIYQGGDTLTLALGIMPSSNSQPSPMAASCPAAAAAPVPQPEASPKLINLDSPNSNSDPTPPISVTHFSPAVNGNGVQKETIFSNTNPFLQSGEGESAAAAAVSGDGKNPFTASNGSTGGGGGKYATIGRTNPFTKNSNPFLDTLANASSTDGGGGGEGSHVTENTSSSSSNDTSMEPVASTTPAAAAAKKTLNKIVSKFVIRVAIWTPGGANHASLSHFPIFSACVAR